MEAVRTVVLSAHADDAALSCGGVILLGALPPPLAVVTVFSESDFAPGVRKKLSREEVTRLREAEDAAFWERIGAAGLRLGLPEPSLRGYKNFASIFDPKAEPRREPAFPKLAELVGRTVSGFPCADLLLAPLALGTHIDHLLLREAAKDIGRERGLPVAYYEDLPYAAELSLDDIQRHVRSFDPTLEALGFDLAGVMADKTALVELYATQELHVFVRNVLAHGHRLALPGSGWKERLWADSRAGGKVGRP